MAAAAGDVPPAPESAPEAGAPAEHSGQAPSTPVPSSDGGTPDTLPPDVALFTYRPAWEGVTEVAVLGAFGQATDWQAPLVVLNKDETGQFTGTVQLPPGTYPYIFRVTGDREAGAAAATLRRYAIDEVESIAACPQASPTHGANPNPCSQLTMPRQPRPATHTVRGIVRSDGAPIAGYLVTVERIDLHHFFVNRTTTAADGSFALSAGPGKYWLNILHPTTLTMNDAERNPDTLAAIRSSRSSEVAFSNDFSVEVPDVAYHAYGAYGPRGTATLPTRFSFQAGAAEQLLVYGTGKDGGVPTIGDSWFGSKVTTAGAADFDGVFTGNAATQDAVQPGRRYFWGTQRHATTDGGLTWTEHSMVYPLVWR